MTNPANISSKATLSEHLVLALILLTAFILRFRYLLEIEHNVDQAYTFWQALNTIERGEFPLAGQGTSVLFANPPLTGYLYIPIVWLTRSLLGVYVFVIALNTLAVWFTYRISQMMLGVRPALIATTLIAVNPWVIEYSRTLWVQSLLPFFVACIAWLLWGVLLGKSKHPTRRLTLALIMTTLFAHTYLLAFFILFPVGVLILLFWRRIPKQGLMIGIAIFTAVGSLYAVGLYQQRDIVRGRIENFGDDNSDSGFTSEAFDGAMRLITGHEYELARGFDAPINDWERRHDLSQPLHYALLAMLGVGVIRLVYGAIKRPNERDRAMILAVWFGLPIIAMSYTSNPIHPFYQLLGIPAGYILVAWGISIVFRPHTRLGASVLLVLGVGFGGLMSVNGLRHHQETQAQAGAHQLFALSLDYGLRMGQVINEYRPDDGLVYANAEHWIIDSFAGEEFPVVWDTRAPHVVTVPREGGVYITIGQDPVAPVGISDSTLFPMPDGNTLAVYKLMPAEAYLAQTNTTPDDDIPTQQGLTLYEYRLEQIDATYWQLLTYWRVDHIAEDVPHRLFAPFAHVFNADGERIQILSGQPIRGPQWRVGDVHVHRIGFEIPEDFEFSLDFGQYDGGNNANVYFLPDSQDPTAVISITP